MPLCFTCGGGMETFLLILRVVTPLIYIFSFIFYLRGFKARAYDRTKTTGSLGFALLVHTVFLFTVSLEIDHLPLTGVFIVLSVFAYVMAIIYITFDYLTKEHAFGVFVLPFVIALQVLSSFMLDVGKPIPAVLNNLLFEIHVLSMLIAYAGYALSFMAGIMYIILFHEIQSRHLGYYYSRLPSLRFLDLFSIRTVSIGFLFMTLGILLGAYNSLHVWKTIWPRDPKMTAVVINWAVYLFLLIGRKYLNWEGHKTSYVSIVGFILILVSFIIISSMVSEVHSF